MKIPCSLFLVALCCGTHWRTADGQVIDWPDPIAGDVIPYGTSGLTHGPLLGSIREDSVRVWLRTRQPTEFRVVFSKTLPLTAASPHVVGRTTVSRDLTASVVINDLLPNQTYFYGVVIDGQLADTRVENSSPWPSLKTLPNRETFLDEEYNPAGLFNVQFVIGHCASQERTKSGGQYGSPPAYDTIRHQEADAAMFAIVNGDIIYEEARDGTLAGVRNNYKIYLSRGRSFSHLFRTTPALFTFDDHDVGWDIHGSGQVGLGKGRHLIRDVGLRAYEEYISWANYRGPQSGAVRLGKGRVERGSDILTDEDGQFSTLRMEQVSTVHLGSYTPAATRRTDFPKSAGVYALKRVIDDKHLQLDRPATATESLTYSIGTHHYYDWRVSNCHFFALDTRGERSNRNAKDRSDPNLFILGEAQRRWLMEGIRTTDAEFIFIISPDPWTIYHTAAHVGGDDRDDKGDGFPSFLHEREQLIEFLDGVQKPVLIFTGDVHASASVKISNNLREIMCGPLGSTGHPIGTLGNPPRGGKWESMGREVEIRWLSGFPNNLPYQEIRNTYYGVVQVNNVLKVAKPGGGYQFVSYDEPQVVVRWHDGYTGRLVYAESLTTRDARD